MKFEIRSVKNGWVLECDDDEIVGIEDDFYNSDVKAFAHFLRTIDDNFGPSCSRYSAERIRIDLIPGDKNESCEYCEKCEQAVAIKED